MRKFLSFATGARALQEIAGLSSSQSSSRSNNFSESTVDIATDSQNILPLSPEVSIAGVSLCNAIQSILTNTTILNDENMSGFHLLIETLNSTERPNLDGSGSGRGCLQILLDNMNHPKFIETCNQIALAKSLIQALRALRLYEIKSNSLSSTDIIDQTISIPVGKSFVASDRLCQVVRVLCTSKACLAQIHQLLVKFMTFPITPLPIQALHFQVHSSLILKQICQTGLTPQLLWHFHDEQLMSHIITNLADLTSLSVQHITKFEVCVLIIFV
jgi:hypothetical protein